MLSKACFIWVLFCVVAILVAALCLRDMNNHLFYRLRVCQVDEDRLKQDLWQKQLRLESLTHPGHISPIVDEEP